MKKKLANRTYRHSGIRINLGEKHLRQKKRGCNSADRKTLVRNQADGGLNSAEAFSMFEKKCGWRLETVPQYYL